jgi:uncharacterized protein YjbI with pentapeptide repeats
VGPSLRGRDFRGASLDGSDLSNADLYGANLIEASLFQTKLENSNLSRASLQRAQLYQAQLDGAAFTTAKLDGARLQYVSAKRTSFNGAIARNADFSRSDFQGSDFTGARLDGSSIVHAHFEAAFLGDATLDLTTLAGTYFIGADLSHADMQASWLPGAHFEGADLSDVSLQGSNLNEVHFKGTVLNGAKLWRAHGVPRLEISELASLNLTEKPWDDARRCDPKCPSYSAWRSTVLGEVNPDVVKNPFMRDLIEGLEPTGKPPRFELTSKYWMSLRSLQPAGPELYSAISTYQRDLACIIGGDSENTDARPFLIRRLLYREAVFGRASEPSPLVSALQKSKGDPNACPVVTKLADVDLKFLDRIVGRKNIGPYVEDFTEIDRDIRELELEMVSSGDRVNPLINRGRLNYFYKWNLEKAIADYTSALAIQPTQARALYYRGRALLSQGNPDRAIADFDAALDIDPNYIEAQNVPWISKGAAR